ncbi:integrase [Halovibrio salipaludis]|uniref:Integrase n=1 Tax=Halovibrio salipaludis TaxID=2032626 RepID=A0A2A2F950_9GAMM|nr:tyrosine-type recombinase/integrase [Halovibrio salipaludis]PAU81122.1 integrase [Halovibrio salipaludis]
MKRDQIKRRPLADSVLNSLEPEARDYRERDSTGLYFRVKPNGSKSWLLRYKRPNGRWSWKGLGGYPAISGKKAREKARELLELASEGHDLNNLDQPAEKILFREAAEDWYQYKLQAGRSSGTTRQMRLYLDNYILPSIGDKPLDEVTRGDCAQIQKDLEARQAFVMASKIRGWLNQMFSLAIGQGKCELNPASELKHIAVDRYQKTNYPYLLESELPAFLKALRGSQSKHSTQVMIWLLLRTASRPGMARYAEWSEIDFDQALWSIPAAKMKMSRDHIVPLPRQSLEDLWELHQYTGRGRYLFPGYGPKHPVMSEGTVNKALGLIGYKGKLVGHGSRHTASTLLREHGWDKQYVESQLAHMEKGIAGVYNKAQYLEQRRKMMQWYADYLDQLENQTPGLADSA